MFVCVLCVHTVCVCVVWGCARRVCGGCAGGVHAAVCVVGVHAVFVCCMCVWGEFARRVCVCIVCGCWGRRARRV